MTAPARAAARQDRKGPREGRPFPRAKRKRSRIGLWFVLALAALVGAEATALELSRPHVTGDRLIISVFIDYVRRDRILDARALDQDSYMIGRYIRDDGTEARYRTPLTAGVQSGLVLGLLVPSGVPTSVDQQSGKRLAALAATVIPALMLAMLFAYFMLSWRRGTGLFTIKSGARQIKPEDTTARFSDVAGQDAAITELSEIRDFLADPQRFFDLGAAVPKGVLLFGPPGCGKTLLARALAAEADASFFSISGSDFMEMYVGVGASRVRDLFREARENVPAIVFIDEVDSIGAARGSHGEADQALNQVLAEMDGFSPTAGIVVLAATNRPDVLDPALLRPGRFDRTIGLERPNEEARLAILAVHVRTKTISASVDLAAIAHRAVGLTGADLANLANEAALLAARTGEPAVTQDHLDTALTRLLEAPERQRRLSQRERSIARRFTPGDDDRVTFADVAGQGEAVAELGEIRDFLVEPERYVALGARIPKGVLLYGPPGCGKTMMARALAAEANAAFFAVAASEFVEGIVGQGAARVRNLFAEARSMPPAIVFLDEIDAVGRARGGTGRIQSHGEADQTLNQILAELDGFSGAAGVVVVGATNRPDMLDPALLRPGRFDRSIGLAVPDEAGRRAILAVHTMGMRLADDVELDAVAARAIGLTGADMAGIANEAALLAGRVGALAVGADHFDQALARVLGAPERQRRLSMRPRSIGRRSATERRVTFADVAGMDDALAELAEVRDYLADPSRYQKLAARAPKGILLSGPPGTGKTLAARAVAGEANAAFISVAATEFVEVFVGEGAARVRDLFAEARAMAPSIVFIDEIDAVGTRRSSNGTDGGREHDQTLNQILVELDGFDPSVAVTVMAATNRPDMLDPALVRPGRFDRQVEFGLPDRGGRRAILDLYARRRPLAVDVDLDRLANLTRGFSGSDLENLVNEAALLATREGLDLVPMRLVDEAVDRARMGLASRGEELSADERQVVACHEAGHALVGLLRPEGRTPHKLTLVRRGGTLGHNTMVDTHDRAMFTRAGYLDEMATALGGMAAEELVFGSAGSGSAGDIRVANNIARQMVRELGMSSLGPVLLDGEGQSEETARAADAEVRVLIGEAHATARSTLSANLTALRRVTDALLEHETLTAASLQALVTPPTPSPTPAPAAGPPTRPEIEQMEGGGWEANLDELRATSTVVLE